MRCTNCGSTLNPNSRFCDQCGAAAADAEETRIARPQSSVPARHDNDDIESVIFTVRPTMLFIKIGYAAAIAGAILLTVLLAMVRYTLTDSKIEIDHGLIARTTRSIPLSKIQDVTVSASILQRMLGFGDVVVDNASEVGGTTILHNINNPRQYADLILRTLRRWQ